MAKQIEEMDEKIISAIETSFSGIETGTAISEGDVFNENLPDGHTKESVEELNNYVTSFVACGLAAGQRAVKSAMKKDKKLDNVGVTVPMGAFGQASYDIHRSKEITIPPAEKGGTPTKKQQFGFNRVDVTFTAGKNSGMLGKARDAVKADFTEEFGKKK